MTQKIRSKILVILGPTATGKSDLAVLMARKFNGEIISADSRQVYTDMNIGTGKVTKKEMRGVTHYLLDVVSPKKVFTVADYKKLATEAIEKIIGKNKLPIICGGTGLYIQSIVDNLIVPDIPPNSKLRKELEKKSLKELFEELNKLDHRRAKNIDHKNKVRLVRAIEIARAIGTVPKIKLRGGKDYEFLQVGLTLDKKILQERIKTRLLKRLLGGMITEVRKLKRSGLPWKRLNDLGLEYRFVANYLRGKMTKNEMSEKLSTAINQYAKRQMTWFKRDKRINWFDPKDNEKIKTLTSNFIQNNY